MLEEKLKKKEEKKEKGLAFKIKLERIAAKNKNRKVIYICEDPNIGDIEKCPKEKKQETFERYDSLSLLNLLSTFDTKKHTMKQYKVCLKLIERVREAWRDDKEEMDLSLDEGSLLKDFCEEFFDEKNAERMRLNNFQGGTVISILEQLER